MPSVVIGEDDVLLREGMARVLADAGVDVVGRAGDAEDLLRLALAQRPDVTIIDIQMPPHRGDDGLVVAMELRRRMAGSGVLVLSNFYEPTYAMDLVRDDASGVGYLLKDRVGDVPAFVAAIDRVAEGGTALDPEVVGRMLGHREMSDPLSELTPRERVVLTAVAEGKSNIGVAKPLGISEAAVERHVTSIFRKLDLVADGTAHRRVRAVLAYLSSVDADR